MINYFIIKYNKYGMVTRCSPCWVQWCSTMSLFFNITSYTLIQFWLSTKKSNTNETIFFAWISNLTICWVKLTMVSFSYIHAMPRNNATQWLTAMLIYFKHICPLCLSTLCHEKLSGHTEPFSILIMYLMVTKEGSTKIGKFHDPQGWGSDVRCDHIRHYSEYILSNIQHINCYCFKG